MSKFLNTKDFFLCTGGLMPSQMQTHQQVAGKKDGETKFLTKIDTKTTFIADFSCRKMMILMAIIAVVICALTIATGGAALIAAAAIGGAVGAAAGALICGCQGAAARMWINYKEDTKIGPLEVPAVTDKAYMTCAIFGEQIRLAPNIKNWWQAALVGVSNFTGEMFKCVMVGAAAAGLVVLASEGVMAFLGNALLNWGASFGLGGLLLRSGMGLNQMVQDEYVNGQGASADSFAEGFWGMETGTAHSAYNVATGQGKPEDYAGLLAWGAPVGGKAEEPSPINVDEMGDNAWEGKPQRGKTGYLESPRMSRAEVQAFKEAMKQKGIEVEIDKDGHLPDSARAGFDPQKGKIYLRKGATDYEAFHESKHAEQWLALGKDKYLQQSTMQREQYVYDQIAKNKSRFSPAELEHAKNYMNRVRHDHGVEPMDAMESLPRGEAGEGGSSGKGGDGDLYEDPGSAGTLDGDIAGELDAMSDDPAGDPGGSESVYHMKSDKFAQGVLDGVDPKYFNDANRFGKGFYIADKAETAIAEVTYHGGDPNTSKIIRFNLDKSKLNELDLTDPDTAKKWGYDKAQEYEKNAESEMLKDPDAPIDKYAASKDLAKRAQDAGYNSIKFPSKRAPGAANRVIFGDSKEAMGEILQPEMIMPASE